MKILVINGSPKNENSDTMHVTRAFLEGMGEQAEFVHVYKCDIRPCRGCFGCWFKTPGACGQKDDVSGIIAKYLEADLVVWSLPLYCYGAPSQCKALIDRMLQLSSPKMHADSNGHTCHSGSKSGKKTLLISGCGFPEIEWNYDGLAFQFRRMFGEMPMIFCVESPLLGFPDMNKITAPYLETVKRAGAEYKATGIIAEETKKILATPMIPPDIYRKRGG